MPEVNEFRDRFKEDLNVVAVHMPRSEDDLDMELIKSSAEEHDITQPIFVDSEMKLTEHSIINMYRLIMFLIKTDSFAISKQAEAE